MVDETDEMSMEEINKRLKDCMMKIISKYNSEENEFEYSNQIISNFIPNYKKEYKEYVEEIEKLNQYRSNVTLNIDNMLRTLDEKNNDLKTYQTELNDLETKYNFLLKEFERLQLECVKTKKKTVLSSVDRTILDLSRKKFELYGEMTNIIWNYTVPLTSGTVTGYVRNKEKNYINAFEYKKNSNAKLVETLWKEIEDSTEVWNDIIDMTNLNKISQQNNIK